jgi:uncharacterized secreted protein with C-terminal beta-propeller domain
MTEATASRAGRRAARRDQRVDGQGGRRRAAAALAALATTALLAAGCTGSGEGPSVPLALVARLVSFDSCDQLLGWFKDEAASRVTAYGIGDGTVYAVSDQMMSGAESAAPSRQALAGGENSARSFASADDASGTSSPAFSTTNVQEVGVGEPDLAVTDGSRLVTVVGGTLRVVDLTGDTPVVVSQLEVPGGASQLLVEGDHALVIGGGWGAATPMGRGIAVDQIATDGGSGTTLTRVDLDGGAHVVGTIEVDAGYVDARMVDGIVRVVTRSAPGELGFVYPSSGSRNAEQRAISANRDIVSGSTLDDWIPTVSVGGDERPGVDCAAVERPEDFSGFEVVTVLGIDLAGGATDLMPSTAVVAGAGTVYASASTLYVATQRWPEPDAQGSDDAPAADADADQSSSSGGGQDGSPGPGAAAPSSGAVEPAPSAAVTAEPEPETTTTVEEPTSTTTTSTPTTRPPATTTTLARPLTTTSSTTTSTTTPDTTPDTSVPLVPDLPAPEDTGPYTDVHAFDLTGDGAAASYVASGRVRGTVLDQFSLSELDGRLRVATTVDGWWTPLPAVRGASSMPVQPQQSESFVTVLESDGTTLHRVGEVGGLGIGEQIYSARFVGDLAYVVTFRQTDPLYVLDLRDPTAPVVAGELKIPGYSSYLQLVDEGRLLGVGQDATDTGRTTGFAESLFDVADPSAPSRLAQLAVPNGYSLAEQDHHALLWWGTTDTLVVPLQSFDPFVPTVDGRWSGVLITTVADDGILERGRVAHPVVRVGTQTEPCPPNADCASPTIERDVELMPQIERSLVVGDRLITVSQGGVMVNDLGTLGQRSWTPFGT